MPYDSDYREADVTALDTPTALTEQGADSPGAFDVPADARRITEILIQVAVDWTADSILGFSSAIRLSGAGITIGEGYFPGPVGATAGGTNVAPGLSINLQPQRYLVNIPVKGGGKINAHGYMHGEDMGSLHVLCQLVYDGPQAGRIRDMDYREQDLTAANTLVNLNTRGGATEGDFKVAYSKIGEIFFGAGLKAVAGPLRLLPALHLSGNALVRSGNYKWVGNSGGQQDDIATLGQSTLAWLVRYITDIDVKIGNTLRAQAQMLEDDAGTAYAIVGLGYV